MSRLPIRIRVTAAFAVAMAVVLAVSGWFLYDRLESHLTAALDRELLLRAQDLESLVQQPSASLARESSSRFVERGESYAQLVDPGGRVVDATKPLGKKPVLDARELRRALEGRTYATRRRVPGLDEPSRLLTTPVSRDGRRLVLLVGVTSQDNAETLSAFRDELLLAGPAALLLACIAGYLLAGLSLRPVESMRRRAAAITAETPGDRLPVPKTGDELERLGATLNEMLERLEAALEHEREFVADAGHELRTPLALLRTELELALRHGGTTDELREAIRSSAQEVDRLTQLAEDLLLIARFDRGRLPLRVETIEVGRLFEAVISRFQWRIDAEERSLVVADDEGLRLRGDRLRLEQALANLVDNALRHGEGGVRLSIVTSKGHVELHVSDDGPGFDRAFLEHAFERFTREHRGREGAGLGLAIVAAIAEAHGGTAHATNLPAGGSDVWIDLPQAPLPLPDAEPAAAAGRASSA